MVDKQYLHYPEILIFLSITKIIFSNQDNSEVGHACHSAESGEVEIRWRLRIQVFNIIDKLKPQDIDFYGMV
jgi:hypothetical protein